MRRNGIVGAILLTACGSAGGQDATPSAGTVVVDGAELRYVVEGQGQPCIVIGSATYYQRLFSDEFKGRLRCAFADTRMFTAGARPPADGVYDMRVVLADVEAVRQALQWDKIVVVGHSMHAHLALEYARAYPDHVSHVVMIGMSPGWPTQEARARLWDAQASPERKVAHEARQAARAAVQADSALTASDKFIRTYVLNSALYWFDPEFDCGPLWQQVDVNVELFNEYVRRSGEHYSVTAAPGLRVPVFVAIGRHDYVVPFDLWDEPARRALPNHTLEIFDRSGHTPQYEEAAEFDRKLIDFLSAPSAPSA
jgi:proline iminopeptidase